MTLKKLQERAINTVSATRKCGDECKELCAAVAQFVSGESQAGGPGWWANLADLGYVQILLSAVATERHMDLEHAVEHYGRGKTLGAADGC